MDKNKEDRIEITELFMAQADKERRFFGTIQRGFNKDGHSMVYGKIKVQDGFILAKAGNQDALGGMLDELVMLVLDFGLTDSIGNTIEILGEDYYLN